MTHDEYMKQSARTDRGGDEMLPWHTLGLIGETEGARTMNRHDRIRRILNQHDFDNRAESLRDEATAVGDYDTVHLCNEAVEGDYDARCEVAGMLADAEAMDNNEVEL
jgi:hypothetical protein